MAAVSAIIPANRVGRRTFTTHYAVDQLITIIPTFVSRLQHTHFRRRLYCSARSRSAIMNTGSAPAASTMVAVRQGPEQSTRLVALEYADLNLTDKFPEELGHLRIRQHVNPLRSTLMVPAKVPNWNEVYEDATLPLMVDIGSGTGRFLMWLAKKNPNAKNYLGLEIKRKLVDRANYWVNELALRNIHFISANASVSFKQLVSAYPGPLMLVSILCPDPHFKRKYRKRRVVQEALVESIVDSLMPGGHVFIQSDVLDVAMDMRDHFDAKLKKLIHIDNVDSTMEIDGDGWLLSNPMGIRTEREIHAEFEGARIYRRMYQKLM
ncbi:OLC1v1001776C1 [Oldenlandia corymbosa var. corymbosa]|uniref:tRNA (guanine(46)-N(7))-methyltransferase n=1 Tax=Oldenlandia corymbosa var. corymbosa TaxID=529605 RepID=A0AAV1D627_OLDCO|nr:OLC1v1001776C1 [Oldenlandia corymbosa var. corymbosa]